MMPINSRIIEPHLRPIDRELGRLLKRHGASETVQYLGALTSLALSNGNTCLDLSGNHETPFFTDRGLNSDVLPLANIRKELEGFIAANRSSHCISSTGTEQTLLYYHRKRLYLTRYYKYEKQVAEWLRTRTATPLQAVFSQKTMQLATALFSEKTRGINYQLAGAMLPFFFKCSFLSGGPGTGKTTTAAKMLALLLTETPDLTIVLAAPTGKAVQRMRESLDNSIQTFLNSVLEPDVLEQLSDLTAKTIHRLLESTGSSVSFRRNETNPLELDILIVDEASMIDLPLMAKLLTALPHNARVVFLGDQFQLASVEAGAVLGEICSAFGSNIFSADFLDRYNTLLQAPPTEYPHSEHLSPVAQLVTSRRFSDSGGIGKLSRSIHNGLQIDKSELSAISEIKFLTKLSDGNLAAYSSSVRNAQTVEEALKNLDQGIILTIANEGPFGQISINGRLVEFLREKDDYPRYMPIMIRENSAAIKLYNGDIGILDRNPANFRWEVAFSQNGAIRRVALAALPKWQPAYAITVHKSQGSEYRHIALLLGSNPDSPLLTRELLYTAITRIKGGDGEIPAGALTICGTLDQFNTAIQRKTIRSSALAEAITSP